MKVSFTQKKLVSALMLLPLTAFAGGKNIEVSAESLSNHNIFLELDPKNTIIFKFPTSQVIINHKSIQELVGDAIVINDAEPVGIKFNEETHTLDFSTLDGLSVTVSMEQVSGAPPNGIGPTR